MDTVGVLLLGSAIGFIGSTLGTIIVDHLALQRQARAELVREVLWRLPHRDVDTRRRGLELLIRNAALLTARERRDSLRLVRLWQQLLAVNLRADAERLGRPGADLRAEREADYARTRRDLDAFVRRRVAPFWSRDRWRRRGPLFEIEDRGD